MPTTTINGVNLYFERHGEQGEPLVLVHGYTGDTTDWRHQVPEFAREYQLLIFDLRGHGKSEAPQDRTAYTVDQMADDTEALVTEVGFERYHLLGHSMGGAVAQEIALRRPRRLFSLTLEDTSPGFGLGRSERSASGPPPATVLPRSRGCAPSRRCRRSFSALRIRQKSDRLKSASAWRGCPWTRSSARGSRRSRGGKAAAPRLGSLDVPDAGHLR